MASISSLPLLPCFCSRSGCFRPSLLPQPAGPSPPTPHRSLLRCRGIGSGESRLSLEDGLAAKRRGVLVQILLSATLLPCFPQSSHAETDLQEESRIYEDEENKFKISIPRGWLVGKGETDALKSVTAFYPEEATESNISIAITGLAPDFTRLGSFGDVDSFAESLVNGMDGSWKNPPGPAAKLINSKAANGMYYVEYTMQNPGERLRHVFSAVGIAKNGWYNRLYAVTGQFMEDESDKFRQQVQNSVSSFRFIQ